jgi:hypothetical protein
VPLENADVLSLFRRFDSPLARLSDGGDGFFGGEFRYRNQHAAGN